ncbi:MAG TPA: TlpA disulfide reductase family protein [Bacteroidales bacterium]|nr:TlpA disulfide reductase family protein [Bacteroidales bacterium]
MKIKRQKLKPLVLIIASLFIFSCNRTVKKEEYLKKVYENLRDMESASYSVRVESWAPFDTIPSLVTHLYTIEMDNPLDTTIGASYVKFTDDRERVKWIYDGHMSATFFHEHKGVIIDSFKIDRGLEFRPLSAPFFNNTRSIIHYILTTEDSISLSFQDVDSAYYYRLKIFEDRQVEFFGKAYHMPENPYNMGETTSQYELWMDKKTNLPNRVRRKMSHDISVSAVSEVKINTFKPEDFNASIYLPDDYEYREWGTRKKKATGNPLEGKAAADWTLQSTENKDISFNELDSKLVLLQFTSVSCGPCRVSIPFLNGLTEEYSREQLEVIAIECTTKSLRALQHYREVNKISYPLLQSGGNIKKDYQISSFPGFFLIDENRNIVHVSKGFAEGQTDASIYKIIQEHL